jgi:hypothetical protein
VTIGPRRYGVSLGKLERNLCLRNNKPVTLQFCFSLCKCASSHWYDDPAEKKLKIKNKNKKRKKERKRLAGVALMRYYCKDKK